MALFIERSTSQLVLTRGDGALEAFRQAGLAMESREQSRASAQDARNSAASAQAMSRFYPNLDEAIAATQPGDTFTTTDPNVSLMGGSTNATGAIRACARTAANPFHTHLGPLVDPVSHGELMSRAADGGSSRIGLHDGMGGAAFATVQQFASRVSPFAQVSVTHWHDEAAHGANLRPALQAAVQAIKDGMVPGRYLMVPPRMGGWTLDGEVVFDVSNLKIDFLGSIALLATSAQHALHFTSNSLSPDPDTPLDDIELFFAEGVTIDGNGDRMNLPEPMESVPAYSALMCNTITRLRIRGGHFTNGAMNSMSLRRCPRHRVERATFSRSRWDNGFTASTDMRGYSGLSEETWGGGTLIECVAHDNYDFGMTAYNATGQRFVRCIAYRNGRVAAVSGGGAYGGGFSYELGYGAAAGAKDYRGRFEACIAYDNGSRGIYIDATGVVVDDDCETWGQSVRKDDTLNISGMGVQVAGSLRGYVGGRHHHNARCGVHLTNASGVDMRVELAADCSDNGWHGARVQNLKSLHVLGKARFIGNGADHVAYSGVYGHGLYCSSGSSMAGTGYVVIDTGVEFSSNAHRAIRVGDYARAVVRGIWGYDNFAFAQSPASAAISLDNLTDAVVQDCHLDCSNLRQTQVISIGTAVRNGIESGTRGNGSTALVLNSASGTRYSTKASSQSASHTWAIPALAVGGAASTTIAVPGAVAGDFVQCSFNGALGMRIVEATAGTGQVTIRLHNPTTSVITGQTLTALVQAIPATAR